MPGSLNAPVLPLASVPCKHALLGFVGGVAAFPGANMLFVRDFVRERALR